MILNKKIFEKSIGEWIHYPLVLLGFLGLVRLFEVNVWNWKGFILGLAFFIALDMFFESKLIEDKK